MLTRLKVLLVAALIVLVLAPVPAGAVAGYGDVSADRYFTEPVQWSVDNSITGLDGPCFSPDRTVTRSEAADWLWQMQDQPSAPAHSFSDVGESGAVSWMVDRGITTGTTPTTFSPDDPLTRAQLAAFLWRLEGQPAAPAHGFSDVHRPWQQGPVSWMVDRGITTGTTPTTFSPDDPLTRAHLVTFLYRYSNKPTVTIDPDSPTCSGPSTTTTTVFDGPWSEPVIDGGAMWAPDCSGFDPEQGYCPPPQAVSDPVYLVPGMALTYTVEIDRLQPLLNGAVITRIVFYEQPQQTSARICVNNPVVDNPEEWSLRLARTDTPDYYHIVYAKVTILTTGEMYHRPQVGDPPDAEPC